MASWQFFTTADVSIFTPSRAPHYQTGGGRRKNVVSGMTIGRKVKSQTRGSDQRTLELRWPRISATDLGNFDTLATSYGGNQAAFKIELPAGILAGVTAGTKVRVRWPDAELRYRPVSADRYELTLTLVEDLV